jgi:predicted glycoside hydrolase/deacetylase ChbG (UPF0249 family)
MPYASEIKKLLPLKNVGIGLHVTLTQGKPVSDPSNIPGLVDENGLLYSKKEFIERISSGKIHREHIYKEIRSQYDKLSEIIGDRLDHFDSHQGLTKIKVVSEALIQLKKEIKIKRGIRVYNKYYLKGTDKSPKLVNPNFTDVAEFGLKRVAVEFVLRQRTKKLGKYFFHSDGLLLTKNHNSLDLFRKLTVVNLSSLPEYFLEIACHPATGTHDLPDTQLKQSRVDEYMLLKSDSFIETCKKIQLRNYSQIDK